jgi:hypothetical protein
MTDHDELVELVAEDLTQSISQMLIEMGADEGQRFAKKALIEFANQTLNGAPQIHGMDLSGFTEGERRAVAEASALVLATIQADTSRVQ